MTGLIVPAGSPLVQFEVQRPHSRETAPGFDFPCVVWVNRIPERRSERYKCDRSDVVWKVSSLGLPDQLLTVFKPGKSCVCICMGRFVE